MEDLTPSSDPQPFKRPIGFVTQEDKGKKTQARRKAELRGAGGDMRDLTPYLPIPRLLDHERVLAWNIDGG